MPQDLTNTKYYKPYVIVGLNLDTQINKHGIPTEKLEGMTYTGYVVKNPAYVGYVVYQDRAGTIKFWKSSVGRWDGWSHQGNPKDWPSYYKLA